MRQISGIKLFSYFDEFSGSNGVQIWIHLFHRDLFSYKSNLLRNLNHSIWMSET